MDSVLPVKILYRLAHFAACKLLDHLFQFWVFLAHDLFEFHRFHTGILELREGPPGLNRLMLPPVADEQHTVIRMEPVHSATMPAQRKQKVLEPKGDYVWGTHQPLRQPRTTTLIEIGSQSKQVVHQKLVEPNWHGHLAGVMKTMQIQEWLDKIQRPDGTKLKIKNVLSAIFSHGVRWELVERNPVCGQGGSPGHRGASTGVRQSSRVSIQRLTLAPDVVRQTLEQLPLREATMALVDAVTALRASELVALKWKHVGWETGILQSEFAMVEGELKETKSRNNPLPLAECVLQVLRLWRENTAYRSDEDWIFASPHYHGKTPYTHQILFRRHIRPVIERISGIKSSKEAPIGWHTLRRSLATLLISNGENVKVAQSQLRHTTPKITLELYAQAASADQQEAHKKVVQMVLPAEFSEKLKARSVTATA